MVVSKSIRRMLFVAFVATTLAVAGCSGDDGAQGPIGPEGPQGPAGPVTTTNPSCAVCHSQGKIQDVTAIHPDAPEEPVVSNVVVSRALDNTVTVTFHVEAGGEPFPGLTAAPGDAGNVRVYMADIVPAGTATTNAPQATWDTSFLERWADEHGDDAGVTVTDLGGGDYEYIMAADLTAINTRAPEADLVNDMQRIYVRADARDYGFHRTAFVADFMMPAAGGATAALANNDTTRTMVVAEACSACHNDPLQEAAHGGGYQTVQVCNMCHSPIGEYGDLMQNDEAWSASLFHKIHAAIDMAAFPDRINGGSYSNVTFPQPVNDCEICHFDAGQDMADAWKTHPTAEVCGTCHVSVDFATGAGHAGGPQADNALCSGCHSATAIEGYHAVVPAAIDVAEFDVTIDMTAPANGDYYVAGETPTVTVTLASADGGPEVDYTAPQDDANDRDGVLTEAELTVYGPRAHADEVLGGGGSLLLPAEDAQVLTDADGFKYQLAPIPEDMAAGTYLVHFEGGDYGVVSSTDYQTHSTATATFQVGTATVGEKVAGDGCLNCHGDTRMHVQGSHPHNVPFDTDACLACHNYSGGYGTPISRRVHAVHSASGLGADGHDRTWTDVTFPQDAASCQACHTSGNTAYKDNQTAIACIGCHGDNAGVEDHLLQNGGQL